MPRQIRRLVFLLAPLVILAACGPTEEQRTTRLLNQRLQVQLAGDVAAHRVALEPLPEGARVTFLDASPAPGGPTVSDRNEGSVRASTIEALLDPALLRVNLTDTTDLPPEQKAQRVGNLTQYLQSMEMGSILQPTTPPEAQPPGQPGVAPGVAPGVTMTISVVCPHRHDGSGYDSGKRKPDCF